jgi:hypothetical protein
VAIRIFDIVVPVQVREETPDRPVAVSDHRLTVRIVMGSAASAEDAVVELARKIEEACDTFDIGDCE